MSEIQFVCLIASLAVSVIAILGFISKSAGNLAAKYRKPFEELHRRVDELEEHKPKCEERFEALECIAGLAEIVNNHETYLKNDREAIVALRRDDNNMAEAIGTLYDIAGDLTEGVHLCMQHDVKGNHTQLLEEWMRDNAASSVKRKDRKHESD